MVQITNEEKKDFRNIKIEVKDDSVVHIRRNWKVLPSYFSLKTIHSIRDFVTSVEMEIQINPNKIFIPLSLGDPTVFGNLKASKETMDAIRKAVDSFNYNGYGLTVGTLEARQAVSEYVCHSQGKVSSDDVILCNGVTSSLDICISALAEAGKNILIPRPGFPMYDTLAISYRIEIRSYNLKPDQDWEIDLNQLEKLIDENTAAMILTNPSNPCGSVFSREHILAILSIAEKFCVPIIADEVYEHLVFPNIEYHSISSLSKNVPILSCGGLAKRFLVPGWRLGWIVIHDRNNVFDRVREGLKNLTARNMGCNTFVQGALLSILKNTPKSYFDDVVETLYKNAKIAFSILKRAKGLNSVMPNGAMYMMIRIDIDRFPRFSNEIDFIRCLLKEQNILCLPGKLFNFPNYFRIVLTIPDNLVRESCIRIVEFCDNHFECFQ